ncbi:MAG: hypothetical protein NTV46_03570 [Verrucomicrobia bacterium]|nr:hypothetical protein [Verrucomicrobiota bacterium]
MLTTAETITTTTVPDGTQITVTHADGRIASTTGDLQPDMSYSYTVSGVGLVTTSAYIDCNTETTVTTTDWAGRPTNITKGTESTDYTYNSLTGQLESVEDADGVRTLYGYNSRGERIVTALDVNGDGDIDYGIDQITYTETYPNDSFLETSTKVWQEGTTPVETIVSVTRRSPNGLITESWTGDPATAGNQPTITESTVGDTETQSWTETTTRPDGTYVVSSYVGGLLHQTISHDSEDNEIASTTIGYGDYNRPVTSTDLRTGETRTAYVSATCDAVKSVTEENGNNDRTTSYTYDSRGRRTAVTHPDTSETSTSYNPDGTVWEVSGAQTYHVSYTYDYAGRKQTMTTYGTEEATTTWNYYAHTGRLKEKLDNSGQGPLYTYTDAGRLATRTSARGRVTSYGYEGGRLMSVDYFGTNTLWETYLADRNTWLELIAEEASQEEIDDAEAAMNVAYAANAAASDQTTPSLSYTRDTLGRILTVTRGGAAHSTYTYDPSTLQLTTEVLNRDNSARTLNRYYDPLGRPLSLKVGTDYTTAYGFDTAGRINRVWDHPDLNATGVPVDGNDVPLEDGDFTYGYQAASYGLVATVTGPAHTVTNTWETTRNVLDTKTNADLSTEPVTISAYNYAVNSIGQRQTVTRSGSKMSAANAIGWNYNSRGELTKEDYNNNTAADPRDRVFQYDAIGNREITANGTLTLGASNYVADALNQYTKANGITLPIGTDPAYDADGNYQRGPLPAAPYAESILVWDAENRLIQVTKLNGDVISFDYDHLSRRISKTVTPNGETAVTTRYLYDGWNLIAEYTGTTLTRTYVWGMDLSGSMQGAGGVGGLLVTSEHGMTTGNPPVPTRTPYYPTFDGNGNVSEYLDDAGEAVAHYEYDAFGNTVATLVDDDVDINKDFAHRFSTKSIDIETGLYYYGYRYYDPLTGRWPSRDPIGERGGMNLNGFVRNDAINVWDLLGNVGGDVSYRGRKIGTISSTELTYNKDGNAVEKAADANGVSIAIDFTFNQGVSEKHCGCIDMKFIQFTKTNNDRKRTTQKGISVDTWIPSPYYPDRGHGATVPDGLPTEGTVVNSYMRLIDTPYRLDNDVSDVNADLHWKAYTFVVCIRKPDPSPENSRNWTAGSVGIVLLNGVQWGFNRTYNKSTKTWGPAEKVEPSLITGYDEISLDDMRQAVDIHDPSYRGVISNGSLLLGVVVMCLQFVSAGDKSLVGKERVGEDHALVKIDLNSQEAIFIKNFTNEVIFKRSLPSAMKYFCSRDEYSKLKAMNSIPEAFIEMNYTNVGSSYTLDCSNAIDVIPKVHIDDIRLQKIEIIPNMPFVGKEDAVYMATYSIDKGASKFNIIYPSMHKIGGNYRFISRFWRMLYFE